MALLHPVPTATLTQKYGPSALGVEPAMFANATRAYWQPFNGGTFYPHYHPALDLAAPGGTPILASEAGRVVESFFDKTNGGGNKVTVEIRPNVRYTSNHMASRAVSLGAAVQRGQVIGTVGTTGWSSGNHDHWQVTIKETDATGVARTFMYNPALFLPGGSMAGDPRIAPITPPSSTRYAVLNGAGINVRITPNLDVGSANIYATSTDSGIVREGVVKWPLGQKMKFGGWVANDDGAWAKVNLGNHYRYVKKELVHFVCERQYLVNVNPGGLDVVHHDPPLEECNTDDADDIQHVDHRTAIGLMLKGSARPCEHCFTEDTVERPTLDVQNHIGDPAVRMSESDDTTTSLEGITVEKEAPTPDVEITEGSDTDPAAEEAADEAEEELNEDATPAEEPKA